MFFVRSLRRVNRDERRYVLDSMVRTTIDRRSNKQVPERVAGSRASLCRTFHSLFSAVEERGRNSRHSPYICCYSSRRCVDSLVRCLVRRVVCSSRRSPSISSSLYVGYPGYASYDGLLEFRLTIWRTESLRFFLARLLISYRAPTPNRL